MRRIHQVSGNAVRPAAAAAGAAAMPAAAVAIEAVRIAFFTVCVHVRSVRGLSGCRAFTCRNRRLAASHLRLAAAASKKRGQQRGGGRYRQNRSTHRKFPPESGLISHWAYAPAQLVYRLSFRKNLRNPHANYDRFFRFHPLTLHIRYNRDKLTFSKCRYRAAPGIVPQRILR